MSNMKYSVAATLLYIDCVKCEIAGTLFCIFRHSDFYPSGAVVGWLVSFGRRTVRRECNDGTGWMVCCTQTRVITAGRLTVAVYVVDGFMDAWSHDTTDRLTVAVYVVD